MNPLTWLLCWFGVHRLPLGVSKAKSIYWSCARCGQFIRGEFGVRR